MSIIIFALVVPSKYCGQKLCFTIIFTYSLSPHLSHIFFHSLQLYLSNEFVIFCFPKFIAFSFLISAFII